MPDFGQATSRIGKVLGGGCETLDAIGDGGVGVVCLGIIVEYELTCVLDAERVVRVDALE